VLRADMPETARRVGVRAGADLRGLNPKALQCPYPNDSTSLTRPSSNQIRCINLVGPKLYVHTSMSPWSPLGGATSPTAGARTLERSPTSVGVPHAAATWALVTPSRIILPAHTADCAGPHYGTAVRSANNAPLSISHQPHDLRQLPVKPRATIRSRCATRLWYS